MKVDVQPSGMRVRGQRRKRNEEGLIVRRSTLFLLGATAVTVCTASSFDSVSNQHNDITSWDESSATLPQNYVSTEVTTEYEQSSSYTFIIESSNTFKWCFGGIIIMMILFRMFLVGLLVRNRREPSLQLAQPISLSILVTAGALAIGGCFFLQPLSDMFCYLREPFILLPLTYCGNILAGRVWRVILLMRPVLMLDSGTKENQVQHFLLTSLTVMAENDWLFCCQDKQDREFRSQQANFRKVVKLNRLIWLTILMTLPQLILQVCNLALPSFRQRLTFEPVKSSLNAYHMVQGGGTKAGIVVGRPACQTEKNQWLTWFGVALMLIPYILTAALSLMSEKLPKAFDETYAVLRSIQICALVRTVHTSCCKRIPNKQFLMFFLPYSFPSRSLQWRCHVI
jgi:hypothetical protein